MTGVARYAPPAKPTKGARAFKAKGVSGLGAFYPGCVSFWLLGSWEPRGQIVSPVCTQAFGGASGICWWGSVRCQQAS